MSPLTDWMFLRAVMSCRLGICIRTMLWPAQCTKRNTHTCCGCRNAVFFLVEAGKGPSSRQRSEQGAAMRKCQSEPAALPPCLHLPPAKVDAGVPYYGYGYG